MKSILLLVIGVLRTEFGACPFIPTHCHRRLQVIDQSSCRSFFLAFKFVKDNDENFFFLLLSTVFWLLKSWLVFVSKCQYLWLKYIVESQYWMNENHHWTSRHQSLKTSVWFNGSSVLSPQLSFFYRIVEKISCNKGSCDSFIVIIGYLN